MAVSEFRQQPMPTFWVSYRQAARMFLHGATLTAAAPIALVVGTWLSLMNQGHLIITGRPPWLKLGLNYVTPFCVASLGFLAGRCRRRVERLAELLQDEPRRSCDD